MKDMSCVRNRFIAHRGIYDNKRIYENTTSAFLRAIKNNSIIEVDLRMLKDGTIICFHDENMERMLHVEGKIERLTYDELCYIARYQIPTFSMLLELTHGTVPLLIELISKTKKNALEREVARMLDDYRGDFAIQSFNIKTLKWFYKNRVHFITGYIIGKRNYRKEPFFKKFDFLNIKIGLYNDKKIKKIREDKFVLGWGVTNRDEYDRYANVFDNLVVDNLLDIIDSK